MEYEKTGQYGFTREEVTGVLSGYVTGDRLESFIRKHEKQIADLQKGRISGVFEGFQKRDNPGETYAARLTLKRKKDEKTGKTYIQARPTFKSRTLNIPESFTLDGVRVRFSEKQRDELTRDGRLSETFKFTGHNDARREMFVSIDRDLNRIAWAPASFLHVPDTLYQTQVTQEQKDALMAGKKARLEMNFKGVKKSVEVYYDPVLHKIRFEEQRETQDVTEGKKKRVEPTEKLGGKQKQQTKAKTVSKGKKIGIDS